MVICEWAPQMAPIHDNSNASLGKTEPLCTSAQMLHSSSVPIVLALTQIGCGNISPCFDVLEPVTRRPQRGTTLRPYKSPLFQSWEPRKPSCLIAALEAVARKRWGFREIMKQKPFYSVSGCSPLSQFASICGGNRAGDTCGQTPRPGKGRSVQLSSNKVKGAMYYAALRVARLIRTGVGCGACVGDSEAELHLGSVPCGCPGLSSQNMNWGRSGGIRNTEEAPGASGSPTGALHPLYLRFDFCCSVKLEAKQTAETLLCC
jgi:hypothetical protein